MEHNIVVNDAGQFCVRTEKSKNGKNPKTVETVITVKVGGLTLYPEDMEQAKLAMAIQMEGQDELPFVMSTGAAGTGKTYFGTACLLQREIAAKAAQERNPRNVVLCRPAVEAEEEIGFLKGGLFEKIAPYFQPVFDVLKEGWRALFKKADPVESKGTVYLDINGFEFEIAPIAFMRGRTFKDTVIVVDEAQNLTVGQIKMVLTRLGENSTMYLCGDVTQTDLPDGKESGLKFFVEKVLPKIQAKDEKLGRKPKYFHTKLTKQYRHEWVGDVVDAFEEAEAELAA
ncbi:MAG: PhoH family protein [Alphaproteobacteria bacterium]|nr:PhoH family protein [Alphaproteobacteria bacterium]